MTKNQKVYSAFKAVKHSGSPVGYTAKEYGVAVESISFLRSMEKMLTVDEFSLVVEAIECDIAVKTSEGTCTKSLETLYKAVKRGEEIRGTEKNSRYVYVVKSGDYYKIGVASSVPSRVAVLQVGNPIKIEVVAYKDYKENAVAMEKQLHKKYEKNLVHGEWFCLGSKEIEDVVQIIEGGRDGE